MASQMASFSEPMNLCAEKPPAAAGKSWVKFGDSLKNKKVTVTGVPRIWPKHPVSTDDKSNPSHAVEIHPFTQMKDAEHGTIKFSAFVFAPDGFDGGLSEDTTAKLLTKATVTVTEKP